VLPEQARFCHRCGAPQLEADRQRLASEQAEDPAREEQTGQGLVQEQQPRAMEQAWPAGLESSTPASRISFKNTHAVIASLLCAAGGMIGFPLFSLYAAPLFPFFLCAVGFVAVRVYRARSAEFLSTGAGARLGWMTGFWLFVVVAIMLAVVSIFVASEEGWRQMQIAWERVPQAARLLQLSQREFLMQLLWTLPFSFFLLTMLPGLGGILGAKFLARRPR
jgi:hypothetical protein